MKNKIKKIKYVYDLCKKREQQGHLSVFRQFLEITILQLTRGVGYDIYHYAEMWQKSASWEYKTSYLSYKDYRTKVFLVNSRKFHGLSQFKPMEKAFFKNFNIPTARYIGTINEYWGCSSDGLSLKTADEIEVVLQQLEGQKVCFKRVQGSNGKGFKAYQILRENNKLYMLHLVTNTKYSIEQLYSLLINESKDGWLIEEYIEQHPFLKAFNPTSLNTIRMFVYQDRNNEVKSINSFLKTGKPGELIDKTENGGAAIFIDQQTGVLLNGFNWSPEMQELSVHPGSNVSLKGGQIPFWKDAEKIAIAALKAYPATRFIGVDIAITETGPLMIEMNVHPDGDCLAVLKIPSAKLFAT